MSGAPISTQIRNFPWFRDVVEKARAQLDSYPPEFRPEWYKTYAAGPSLRSELAELIDTYLVGYSNADAVVIAESILDTYHVVRRTE